MEGDKIHVPWGSHSQPRRLQSLSTLPPPPLPPSEAPAIFAALEPPTSPPPPLWPSGDKYDAEGRRLYYVPGKGYQGGVEAGSWVNNGTAGTHFYFMMRDMDGLPVAREMHNGHLRAVDFRAELQPSDAMLKKFGGDCASLSACKPTLLDIQFVGNKRELFNGDWVDVVPTGDLESFSGLARVTVELMYPGEQFIYLYGPASYGYAPEKFGWGVRVVGTCRANEVPMVDGTCGCNVGLTLTGSQTGLCIPCAEGKFKDFLGGQACESCSVYFNNDLERRASQTRATRPECGCATDYYLKPETDKPIVPVGTFKATASELWDLCKNTTYRPYSIRLPWMPFHITHGYPEWLVDRFRACREAELPLLLNSYPVVAYPPSPAGASIDVEDYATTYMDYTFAPKGGACALAFPTLTRPPIVPSQPYCPVGPTCLLDRVHDPA